MRLDLRMVVDLKIKNLFVQNINSLLKLSFLFMGVDGFFFD